MSKVIVIGSGIAGLTCALTASATHSVLLVTKSELRESNTFYAQGGIAAALGISGAGAAAGGGEAGNGALGSDELGDTVGDDSVAAHVADTLAAGAGLNNADAVDALCAEGPERIRDLIRLGVPFDRSHGKLSRGLEAAHSHPRVLHAGGDATGAAIETTLIRALGDAGVQMLEYTFVVDLIVRGGTVVGVETLSELGERSQHFADAVIVASGGAGQLFRHTTNPSVTTGDGVAAAWRAGAQLTDLEFYQFHPTALALPGNFLVSEAVRGEGAVLLNRAGERFLLDVHPDAELAPRDVVARGIAVEMAAQNGEPVYLDARALGAAFLARRFPTIDAACRRAGLDWSIRPIPVTPAAHYWMGGIATDIDGRTTLPGLFAVGEAACTGAHGANRLASNSLLESLVFGHRAAQAMASTASDWPRELSNDAEGVAWLSSPESMLGSDEPQAERVVDRTALQQLMWDAAGVHRSGAGLRSAAAVLSGWRSGDLASPSATVRDHEDANLLELARLMIAAAEAREESRGAHFRTDFPNPRSDALSHTAWERKVTVPC